MVLDLEFDIVSPSGIKCFFPKNCNYRLPLSSFEEHNLKKFLICHMKRKLRTVLCQKTDSQL